jgi:signal transduction histidine kinase
MTGRLHFRIWLAFLLIVAVAAPVTFIIGRLAAPRHNPADYAKAVSGIIIEDMIRLDAKKRAMRMRRIGQAMRVELGFFDPQGALLAATPAAPPLPANRNDEGFIFRSPSGMAAVFKTENGYWVTVSHSGGRHPGIFPIVVSFVAFCGALFIGSYILSRRLTGRLERLQNSVATWDARQAPAPIRVEGEDEVARLAESFNVAGERITRLLSQQRALLANASHELRTPLARIRLAAEIMAGAGDGGKRSANLATIHEDILEMDALVDDILLAARLDANPIEKEALEKIDLMELAGDVAGPSALPASGSGARVIGGRKLLRRMIGNLMENARKHAPGAPAEVEIFMDGGSALIRVSDRGSGLAEGEHERVFDPFFRGRGAGPEGYGLGLSIVKKIAERHGGSAGCAPREGGGTVFTVRLPGRED